MFFFTVFLIPILYAKPKEYNFTLEEISSGKRIQSLYGMRGKEKQRKEKGEQRRKSKKEVKEKREKREKRMKEGK